jgi:hypothetical protein
MSSGVSPFTSSGSEDEAVASRQTTSGEALHAQNHDGCGAGAYPVQATSEVYPDV